jgi:hypothetical protein
MTHANRDFPAEMAKIWAIPRDQEIAALRCAHKLAWSNHDLPGQIQIIARLRELGAIQTHWIYPDSRDCDQKDVDEERTGEMR